MNRFRIVNLSSVALLGLFCWSNLTVRLSSLASTPTAVPTSLPTPEFIPSDKQIPLFQNSSTSQSTIKPRLLRRGLISPNLKPASSSIQVIPSRNDSSGKVPQGADLFDNLVSRARQKGSLKVIIGLKVSSFKPEGNLANQALVTTQRRAIANIQNRLMNRMAGSISKARTEYAVTAFTVIPYLSATLPANILERLKNDPDIISVQEDVPVPPLLAESTSQIRSTNTNAAGYTGQGWTVAVLDTGVQTNHPFLAGKTVAEACFSSTVSGQTTTVCPNGQSSQIGAGAGINCNITIPGCDHGTHVSGIAVGRGGGTSGVTYSGVAPNANLIAIQVFSRLNNGTGVVAYNSDTDQALQQVYNLRSTYNIASVNMSLGGGSFTSQAACDSARPSTKAMIDTLRSVGIATVIASGNDGSSTSLSAPGCISTAVSVGSVGDGSLGSILDQVSSFSNSAGFLSLLAPGQWITSSVPTNTYETVSGTSQATPHVAGAWAVYKQRFPTASVSDVLAAFQQTGLPIRDSRNGVTRPRIDVFSATTGAQPPQPPQPPANNNFVDRITLSGSRISITGTNLLATKEAGEPNHAGNTGGRSVWWQWTPAASGTVVLDTLGSTFDTTLGVYTGTSVNGLTTVASNDDIGGGNLSSRVSFQATAGTPYQIAVDGYNAQTGNINLNILGAGAPTDFNQDGRSDLLWRNDNGSLVGWTMSGVTSIGGGLVGVATTDWKVVGTGDLNKDSRADILWRNDNGSLYVWYMNGLNVLDSSPIGSVTTDWKIASVADFNRDGNADILWRNDNGTLAVWYMNGINFVSVAYLGATTTDWKIAGSGDFNNDGNLDLLWRNDNGSIAVWYLNGSNNYQGFGSIGQTSSDWKVVAVGDYNADGRNDLIFQNDNGALGAWYLNGATYLGFTFLSPNQVDPSWKIVAPR